MFDLEMSFRNKYKQNSYANFKFAENKFIELIHPYINDMNDLIERFEQRDELIFNGSLQENIEQVKALKFIIKAIKKLRFLEPALQKKTLSGYANQVQQLSALKNRYGKNFMPFLAVDPRRKDMARLIKENVGRDKKFWGVKLYAPNGYTVTDRRLFDDSSEFID
jgi:predicted TIM-barrel fold metal-dependent hydrolase